MHPRQTTHNQAGFSLVEMIIAISVMVIITGGVMTLMKSSMVVANATYEMTDAQQNLRIAQEYINRDLINAGDGLKSMSVIRLPEVFVENYLTQTAVIDATDSMPTGIINFGILTSDNNVVTPVSLLPLPVVGAVPAANIRILSDGTGTDRQTILAVDSQFNAGVPVTPFSIDNTGVTVTLPLLEDMTKFHTGEIYFFSSVLGGTFGTITAIPSVGGGVKPKLTFGTGTPDLGLNISGANNTIKAISNGGLQPTSIQRIQIIHYYVNSSSFLMRRVFGVQGTTGGTNNSFRDSIIAEHVLNVQFKYSLETTDAAGNVLQPTVMLDTKAKRLGVRQVEVTVSVETPHATQNNAKTNLTMTTSTSVRNMQFRQATQPGS